MLIEDSFSDYSRIRGGNIKGGIREASGDGPRIGNVPYSLGYVTLVLVRLTVPLGISAPDELQKGRFSKELAAPIRGDIHLEKKKEH